MPRSWIVPLLALGLGAGCAAAPERPEHVLVLLVDTLRRDHVSTYGYERDTTPAIDALAAEGLLFEDAIAQASWTLPSIASLFTSRRPGSLSTHGPLARMSTVTDDAVTLAEVLAEAGFRTWAVTTNPYFAEPIGLLQGFQERRVRGTLPAGEVVDEGIALIDAHLRQDTPARFFLYLHFMDVHGPHHPPPEFADRYPTLDGAPHKPAHRRFRFKKGERLDTEAFRSFRSHKLALYDGSLRFLDGEIGRLLAHLRATGLLDRTLIVFAADHGEEFWDHAALERELGLPALGSSEQTFGVGHGHTLFPEQLEVPLILRGPGVPVGRVGTTVRNLDVAPTVLAALGLAEAAPTFAGSDLLRSAAHDRAPGAAISETRTHALAQASVQDAHFQYLRLGERELLYDRSAPTLSDLASERPDELARYRETFDRLLTEEPVPAVPLSDQALEAMARPEVLEALRALGYVE